MVEVGGKPILWHIMKILSEHGISDFIVCAGYKSELISNYFLNFNVTSRPFTVNLESGEVKTHGLSVEAGWNVTVVDTGELTPTGGRIKAIEEFIDEEDFFVTYGDGLANVDITQLINSHRSNNVTATITAVQPQSRFGVLDISADSLTGRNSLSSRLEKLRNEEITIPLLILATQASRLQAHGEPFRFRTLAR
jgi:glucose-1-phosphate cytidylyltransferase